MANSTLHETNTGRPSVPNQSGTAGGQGQNLDTTVTNAPATGPSQESYQGANQVEESSAAAPQQEERHEVAQTTAPQQQQQTQENTQTQEQSQVTRPSDVQIQTQSQNQTAPKFDVSSFRVPPAMSGYEDEEENTLVSTRSANELNPVTGALPNASIQSREQRTVTMGDEGQMQWSSDQDRTAARNAINNINRARFNIDNDNAPASYASPGVHQRNSSERRYANDHASARFSESKKDIKEESQKELRRKGEYNGGTALAILVADDNIKPNEVGLGIELLEEAINSPNSDFLQVLNAEIGTKFDSSAPTYMIRDAINHARWEVVTGKSPINRSSSTQRRVLRIVEGKGIHIHPTQNKGYNADFDSDQMAIQFQWGYDKDMVKDSMDFLIDVDGRCTIDPDFFLIPVMEGTEEEVKYVVDTVLSPWLDSPKFNELAQSLFELSRDVKSNELWKKLIYAIDGVAQQYTNISDVRSEILYAIYNGMRDLHAIRIMDAETRDEFISDYIAPESPIDMGIMEILDGCKMGQVPRNFQDFKRIMNRFTGEIEGKNAPWRVSAEVAKLIRWDSRIRIGEHNIAQLYALTMNAGETMRISHAVTFGDRQKYAAQILRTKIIEEVGMPYGRADTQKGFYEFLQHFALVYERYANLANASNVQVLTNLALRYNQDERDPGIEIDRSNFADVAKAFIHVYGEYNILTLFGNGSLAYFGDASDGGNVNRIIEKYKWKTLRQFASCNSEYVKQKDAKELRKRPMAYYEDNGGLVNDLLTIIADRKTSQASRYNNEVKKLFEKTQEILKELNQIYESESTRDWQVWMQDLTELVFNVSPDIFAYYKMDTVEGFLKSDFGLALLEAKTADEVGGIYEAMLVEYRLSRVRNAVHMYSQELSRENYSVNDLARNINKASMELDELASSSDAWATIIAELKSSSAASNFNQIKARISNNERPLTTSKYPHYKKWAELQHTSLIDVLLDPKIGYDDKNSILADVSRETFSNPNIFQFQMGFQLQTDPDATFAGIGYSSDGGIFDTLKSAKSGMERYDKRSYTKARKEVDDAYKQWAGTGAIFELLADLDSNPSALVQMPNSIYVDALLSVMDKTYDNSEKSSQQPGPNSLFQALYYVITGGNVMASDVYTTDNGALGVKQKDQVTMRDLIHILANGDASVWIYDEMGRAKQVTRADLFGKDESEITEDDIWKWLKDHPRLAMSLRQHRTNVIPKRKANVFLSATKSISESILQSHEKDDRKRRFDRFMGRSIVELWDRYGFGAMNALFVPMQGNVSRNLRQVAARNVNDMFRSIRYVAAKKQHGVDVNSIAILEDIIQLEDGRKFNSEYLVSIGMDETEAKHLISEIAGNIDFYADRLVKIADEVGYRLMPNPITHKFPNPDLSSVAAYYDVKQELCGAKTQVSTGVEGTETYKQALWTALYGSKDDYDDLGNYTLEEALELLQGAELLDGTIIDATNMGEIYSRVMESGEEIIVKLPDDLPAKDQTLDDHGEPISSLNRWLMIKRDEGAEKLNLKKKKLGDDGSDSVTKLYDRRSDSSRNLDSSSIHENVFSQIKTQYLNGGMQAARDWLARYLMDFNENLGYDDMSLNNYLDIAKELLIEKEVERDDGETGKEIYIRSWEQVTYAIKHRLSADMIENGNQVDLHLASREIASTVGVEEFIGDPSTLFDNIRIAGSSAFSPVLRQHSSSWQRNFSLMNEIHKQTQISAISNRIGKAITNKLARENKYIERVQNIGNYYILGNLDSKTHIPKYMSIGKQTAYVLDRSAGPVNLNDYYYRGNTIIVDDPSVFDMYPEPQRNFYKSNLVQMESGIWLLPFFDMRLNGYFSDGKLFGRSASFQAPIDAITYLVEDTTGEWALGDARVQLFDELVNRISIDYSDVEQIPVSTIFADTFRTYQGDDYDFEFDLMSDNEIQRFILEQNEEFAIDYGSSISNRSFETIKNNVDQEITRYIERSDTRDHNGWLIDDNEPNNIVAWVVCHVYTAEGTRHVIAPLQPWKTGTVSMSSPAEYSIDSISFNQENSSFDVVWHYSGDPTEAIYKMFDGSSPSNKMVGAAYQSRPSPMLRNDIPIDAAVYHASTASRRLGTNKRMDTLATMWFTTRKDSKYSYNFAELREAFPQNPDIKERLLNERISVAEWSQMLPDIPQFHSDPYMDAFVKKEVSMCLERGINPSDFLACKFGNRRSNMYFEFHTIMETSKDYQDSLLHYFHAMMPTFCPDGMDGDWKKCLFRPCLKNDPQRRYFDDEYDLGCMQMQVPHTRKNGQTQYVWQNVYASFSFFGEEYSGFHRPNVNGASVMNDQLNALALHGKLPWNMNFRSMVKWAASDVSHEDRHGALYADVHKSVTKGDGK